MDQLTENMELKLAHYGGKWVATVTILCCPMRKAKGLPGPEQAIAIVGRGDRPTMAIPKALGELREHQAEVRDFFERNGFSPYCKKMWGFSA